MTSSWTPNLVGSTASGNTTYSHLTGSYSGTAPGEIGGNMTIQFDGSALASSAQGDLLVDGFPFVQSGAYDGFASVSLFIGGAMQPVTPTFTSGSSQIVLVSASGGHVQVSELNGTCSLTGGFFMNAA